MPRKAQAIPDVFEKVRPVYEKLKEVRKSTTLSLKPSPYLNETIRGLDGEEQPLRLRYYQCQGIFHLLVMPRMILGDGTGLGKTAQAIGSMCYLWPKEPSDRIVVVAPKSALLQWADEIRRFAKGVRPVLAYGTRARREKAYDAFFNAPAEEGKERTVLLLNYQVLIRDWLRDRFQPTLPNGRPDPKTPVKPGMLEGRMSGLKGSLVVFFDEAQAFKSDRTRTWSVCQALSLMAKRSYGLTATLLKNHLLEGYCIFKVILPDLFSTKTTFMDNYCVTRLQPVPKTKKKLRLVVGYRNLGSFRERIDPFYLGRPKHAVSTELPTLATREVVCTMSAVEDAKYQQALEGVLELGDGELKDFEDNRALVSLIYCQEVTDSLALLRFKEGDEVGMGFMEDFASRKVAEMGSKEQALVDLLTEELDEDKVIVYTRFEKLVGRLQDLLKKTGIESVRITGAENGDAREKAKQAFQDLESSVRVVFITSAGSEAINLQAASAMIFFDAPWSWGDYVQCIGRMVRIGSPHRGVLVYHLVAERPLNGEDRDDSVERHTIDRHVLDTLRKKKGLIDKVLGEAAVGALEFGKERNSLRELVSRMQGRPNVS